MTSDKKPIGEGSPLLPTRRENDREIDRYNKASTSGAVFNLSTTIIGAGIMALPAAMKVLGLFLAILSILLVAVLANASIEMLLRYSKAVDVGSYGDAVGSALGAGWRKGFQGCIMLNNAGILVIYMIIIGDVLSGTTSDGIHHAGVLGGWFGSHWWTSRFFVLLFTTLAVFAPLACLKRIDSLRFTSAIAVVLALFFPVITAYIVVYKWVHGDLAFPRLLPQITDINSFWNIFTVFPVIITAFVCHFNVHTVNNELEDPSKIYFVVRTSLAVCSGVYILTSLFGFLLFGESTLDDVLANFDADLGIPYSSVLSNTIRLSYVIHLMLVFPLIFYPLRQNLDDILFSNSQPLALDNRRFALISFGLILFVFIGANFIPSIWVAFQLTGATAATSLGFIFPPAIALKDPLCMETKNGKLLAVVMLCLAVVTSGVAVGTDAYNLLAKSS